MITLLKLGGSLITDKDRAHTARPDILARLAQEIFEFRAASKEPLIIGHGSGSFGHVPAKHYDTRNGVRSEEEWRGFAEVHAEATTLNRIVTDILRDTGLPVLSFVPMDNIRTEDGKITRWDTDVLENSIEKGLIPMIFGDTIFDSVRGGTILSTEDLFTYLCHVFSEPPRILLAGLEEGVWRDFPHNTDLLNEISIEIPDDDNFIRGSASTDVTGGMYEKVRLMKNLVHEGKAESALIFSGMQQGNIKKALSGLSVGTLIRR